MHATALPNSSVLADRYRIERQIGEGGMATVFLARDLKHDREVAIKMLHAELGAILGAERFLSEIRTTARLQHPHILPLLDSGESDGRLFYVMPYVSGESLRQRLERERQLPIDEAVRIAREVADALQHAHASGVIHRDIKPENILLQGNHALVADFGIALAVSNAGGSRMTQTGLSLGTPQYMSPEQAMGEKTLDPRADIYALGAVLYEMLAGEPPFTGASVQIIVAKVLSERPTPLRTLRDTVPPIVDQATLKALAKLPADRFSTAAEFATRLRVDAPPQLSATSENVLPPRSRASHLVTWILGIAVVVLSITTLVFASRSTRDTGDAFAVRTQIPLDIDGPIAAGVLSPDGHTVVFHGRNDAGQRALFIRRLDQLESREIPGTQGAYRNPSFSPDGKSIAFNRNRRAVMKVSLDGGAPVALATVPDYGGISWSASGEIVLGAGVDEGLLGLSRVREDGGPLVPLTRVDTSRHELSHQAPKVLADGRSVLFTIWYGSLDKAEIGMTSLDDGRVTPLGILGVAPLGVIEGRLIYLGTDGTIMAVPFDQRRRRVTGTPTLLLTGVPLAAAGSDHDEVSLSANGGLTYLQGTRDRSLLLVDRSGKTSPMIKGTLELMHVRLAPDGRRAALTMAKNSRLDIWILDLNGGTLTPLTTTGSSRNPMWSSDGRRILYASTHSGRAAFWWQPVDGSSAPQLAVVPRRNPWLADLSPDNRFLVYNGIASSNFDLESIALDSTHAERDISASPTANEAFGRFSPDGKWIAYVSEESGRMEVYLGRFASGGGRVQISTNGGRRPVWSADGKHLYFWEDDRLVDASLEFAGEPSVSARRTLFAGKYGDDFDVMKDGQHFLMIGFEAARMSIVVVPNWKAEFERLTSARK